MTYDAFFKAVTVDPGGYGISWNDAMDVSADDLWRRGVAFEASSAEDEERASSTALSPQSPAPAPLAAVGTQPVS